MGSGIRKFRLIHAERAVKVNPILYGVNALHPPNVNGHISIAQAACTEMQTIGATVLRVGITWSTMQSTVGGTINWQESDLILSACQAAGITPIFVIETTPLAYLQSPYGFFAGTPSVLAIPTVTDPKFTQWVTDQTAWFSAVVTRYGTQVLYEWWNEWASASGYWRENNILANKPTVAAWCTAFKSVYAAGKAVNPNITIAVGGLTALTHWFGANATTGVNVIPLLASNSVTFDAMSIHPYTGDSASPDPAIDNFPTGNSFDDIGRIQTAMVANGFGSKPIWVTEWGNYSAAAVGGESVKAGYVTTSLNAIKTTYGTVGPTNSPVTIATFYQLDNNSNGTTDTTDTGLFPGTPLGVVHTQLASGTAYQTFVKGLAFPVLQTITLSGPTTAVMTHTPSAYTATGTDSAGNIAVFTPAFASSQAGVATINSSTGVITTVGVGTTSITATATNSIGQLITSNPITLTVSAQVATSSVVSPNPWAGLSGGSTIAFTVVVNDQSGGAMSSPSGAWSSSDGTNAAINSGSGVLTPTGAAMNVVVTFTPTGRPTAAGTSTGNISAPATPVLTTITLSGASSVIATHTTTAYTAPGVDQSSNPFSYTPLYQSSNTAVATINSGSGIATGLTAGTTSITATNIFSSPVRLQHPVSQTLGSVTMTQPTGSGNLVLVRALMSKGAAIATITDNATGGSNTYAQAPGVYVNATDGIGGALDIWYAKNSRSGATTLTITYSGSPAAALTYVDEWADLDPSNPFLIAKSFWAQTAGTVIGSASAQVTIGVANAVLFGIGACPNISNTISGIHSGNPFTIGDTLFGSATAHLVTSSTGTYFPQWDQGTSGEWFASVAAFQVAPQPPAVTSNAITLTVSAQTPTGTIVVAPASATIAVNGAQFLTPTVSDQGTPANVISSTTVTWGSSDATKATVDSTGLVTGVATGTATITATDGSATGTCAITVSGSAPSFDPTNSSTGQGILLTNGATPLWSDWPNRYANDTAFRAAISSNLSTFSNPALAGTAAPANWVPSTRTGNHYGDGRDVDLQVLVSTPDATFGPNFSEKCWEATLPAQNLAASTLTPELYPVFGNTPNVTNVILMRRLANCSTPKFTGIGDGNASYNSTSNAAWKSGPFASFSQGRAGQETGNYNLIGGNPQGQIFLLNDELGGGGGFAETVAGSTDATWYSGAPRWEATVLEQWQRGSDGTFWCAATLFTKTNDTAPWTQNGPRIISQKSDIGVMTLFGVNSNDNYNQSRATNLKLWYMQAAIFDLNNPNNDGSNDPGGFYALAAAATPSAPPSISVTSHSSSSITCTVGVSRSMAAVRLMIDGTFINGQDYTLKREDAEVKVVTGVNQPGTIAMTVTGLSLGTGSHTVRAYAVNKNGTAIDPVGVLTTFTQ